MSNLLPHGDSLLVLEIKNIVTGYEVFQQILGFKNCKPIEGFPTLTGQFVIIINGKPTLLKDNQSEISKLKKNIFDSVFIEKINEDVIRGFYNLIKTSPSDTLFVAETKSLSKLFQLAQAGKTSGLELIEVRSGRSLVGTNLVILSGSAASAKALEKKFKKDKKIKFLKSVPVNSMFSSFFSFPG